MPSSRRPQVTFRAGCPGEVVPPGPATLTGLCPLSPGHCRGRAGCSSRHQDAPAATAVPRSMARDQRSTHVPVTSTVPPRPWAPCISALLHGAVGELGFRHSPVPCGTTAGGRNILAQRGAGALDQGLPPSAASCSSWHFLGAATVPKPHLPLLLPPPGGTRGTGVTRASHIPGTER